MQAPEKNATPKDDTREEWRHSFWDSLVSFWGSGEPEQRLESETLAPEAQRLEIEQRWRIDEWDFSAEHGYEPEFEGRSEFEYGEFDRWL